MGGFLRRSSVAALASSLFNHTAGDFHLVSAHTLQLKHEGSTTRTKIVRGMRSRLAGAADTAVAPFLFARWALWARKCPALRFDGAGENADGADEDADSFMKLANSTYSTVVEEKEPLASGDEVGDDLSVGTLVVLIFDEVGESKDKPRGGIPNSGKQSGIYVVTKSKSEGAPAADQEENSAPTSSTTLLQRVDVHNGKLQVTDATIVHDKDQAYQAFPFPGDEGVTVRVQAADEAKSGLYQLTMDGNLRAVLKRANDLETRLKGLTETFFGIAEEELGQRLDKDLKRQFDALRTEISGAQQEEVAEQKADQEQENIKDGNAPDADENDKGNKKGTAGRRAGGAKKGVNPITALRRRIRVRGWSRKLLQLKAKDGKKLAKRVVNVAFRSALRNYLVQTHSATGTDSTAAVGDEEDLPAKSMMLFPLQQGGENASLFLPDHLKSLAQQGAAAEGPSEVAAEEGPTGASSSGRMGKVVAYVRLDSVWGKLRKMFTGARAAMRFTTGMNSSKTSGSREQLRLKRYLFKSKDWSGQVTMLLSGVVRTGLATLEKAFARPGKGNKAGSGGLFQFFEQMPRRLPFSGFGGEGEQAPGSGDQAKAEIIESETKI